MLISLPLKGFGVDHERSLKSDNCWFEVVHCCLVDVLAVDITNEDFRCTKTMAGNAWHCGDQKLDCIENYE